MHVYPAKSFGFESTDIASFMIDDVGCSRRHQCPRCEVCSRGSNWRIHRFVICIRETPFPEPMKFILIYGIAFDSLQRYIFNAAAIPPIRYTRVNTAWIDEDLTYVFDIWIYTYISRYYYGWFTNLSVIRPGWCKFNVMYRNSFLHARPWIPGGEKSIFTAVIH